jgi:hypothetical protein
MVVDVNGTVPDPEAEKDPVKRHGIELALGYMGLEPNTAMRQITLDKIFIGSCTNAGSRTCESLPTCCADTVSLTTSSWLSWFRVRGWSNLRRKLRVWTKCLLMRVSNGVSRVARCVWE